MPHPGARKFDPVRRDVPAKLLCCTPISRIFTTQQVRRWAASASWAKVQIVWAKATCLGCLGRISVPKLSSSQGLKDAYQRFPATSSVFSSASHHALRSQVLCSPALHQLSPAPVSAASLPPLQSHRLNPAAVQAAHAPIVGALPWALWSSACTLLDRGNCMQPSALRTSV